MAVTTSDIEAPPAPVAPAHRAPLLPPLSNAGGARTPLWEIVRVSLDSLVANKTRSILTMLGVIIGVMSVVALLALGNGASNAITNQVRSFGTNVLTIVPGSPGGRGPGGGGSSETLSMDDATAIEHLGLPLNSVAPSFGSSAQVVAPSADTTASVNGITASYLQANNLTLASGIFINDSQVSAVSPVAVLGATAATKLFGTGQAVGETIRIKGQPARVIGVLQAKGGGGFGSIDDEVLVPISVAQQRLFGARTSDGNAWRVSSIALSAKNSEDIDGIQERIKITLRDRHHLKSDGSQDDFQIFNQAELLSTLTTITTLLTAFLGAVAGISLLVGGIGIMNIMLVSVTERTREIGLRKAVGARGRDILMQFIVEALTLSVTGGLIGLLLGVGIATAVTLSGLLTASVTVSSVVLALGFSMAVGLFFGIWPARRAARLNPIDALRHE